MPVKLIPPTPSAYGYPLLIKHLLQAPMVRSPDQEIVYRDLRRHTYRDFRERISRLASGLSRSASIRATSSPSSSGTATAITSATSPCR